MDGVVRMRDRVIPDVDVAALRRPRRKREEVWGAWPNVDPLERTAESDEPVVRFR